MGTGTPGAEQERGLGRAVVLIAGALVAPALAGLLLYTFAGDQGEEVGVALLVATGAFALGGFFGFLFGIPKALTTPAPAAAGASVDEQRLAHQPNTNLERISDWLTTILIGAGLVQLGALVDGLGDVGEQVGRSFGTDGDGTTFAIGLILTFLFAGFLLGYISTRVWLQRLFAQSDRSLTELVGLVAVKALDEQSSADARAVVLSTRQLEDRDAPPTYQELLDAFKAASSGTLAQIYYSARKARRGSRDAGQPHAVARTVPVFRALAESDAERRFFLNWGELATALKESDPPNDDEAIAAYSTAIELRDRDGPRSRYELLEWGRAICRIRRAGGGFTDPAATEIILADLRTGVRHPFARDLLVNERDAIVKQWLAANQLDVTDVTEPVKRRFG